MKSTDLKKQWIGQAIIGEIIHYWVERLLRNSDPKCMCPMIRFCVLAEKCQERLEAAKNLRKWSHQRIRPKSRQLPILGCHRYSSWIRVEDLRGKTTIEILQRIKNMGKRNNTSSISRQDNLYVHVQRHWVLETEEPNECWNNAVQLALYARDFKPGHCSCLGPGERKDWYGSVTKNRRKMGLDGADYDARIR